MFNFTKRNFSQTIFIPNNIKSIYTEILAYFSCIITKRVLLLFTCGQLMVTFNKSDWPKINGPLERGQPRLDSTCCDKLRRKTSGYKCSNIHLFDSHVFVTDMALK